jgi:hypothetical protein
LEVSLAKHHARSGTLDSAPSDQITTAQIESQPGQTREALESSITRCTVSMLGRRRRRYPSLQAFVTSLHQQRKDDRRKTKAYDEVSPSHVLIRPRGPRGIRPTVIGPRMEKRVMGLICNSFSVMTVCNPPLWKYSGDSPGARGHKHKRPYIGTLDTRALINTPVQCP